MDVSGRLAHATTTSYDNDGRVSLVAERGRSGSGWLGFGGDSIADLAALSNVLYSNASGASGYDAAGRLTTYRYQHLSPSGDLATGSYTHTYTTTYEARDTYLEKSISGTSDNTNYKPTTTTSTYDPTGRRVAVTQTTPLSGQDPITRLRYFSYNADGGILTRRDGTLDSGAFTETADSRQHYAYANGQQVAALGEDGTIDAATQLTAFDSSDLGTTPALVLEGDTLQSIAQRVYGNPSLWYVLAAANAVTDADLVAGTTLQAPEVKTTANDASTFKPFDPNSIIGPTTPSLPYIAPPPQQHCNAVATILMVVVAVAVTYFTAGTAGSYFATAQATAAAGTATAVTVTGAAVLSGTAGIGLGATLASGFVAGAAGSLASQALGSAMGVSSFSRRDVAATGITTALTAGIGSGLQNVGAFAKGTGALNKLGQTVQGVAGYGAGVVGQAATGQDAHFSWSAVAATAVGAVLSANLGGKLPLTQGGTTSGRFLNDFGSYLVNGVSNATSRRLFGLGEQDWGQIATDAFGNALGNAAVGGISKWQANRAAEAEANNPFGKQALLKAYDQYEADQSTGDNSFLDRYPYATTSLANGDVPRSNAINVSMGNALLGNRNQVHGDNPYPIYADGGLLWSNGDMTYGLGPDPEITVEAIPDETTPGYFRTADGALHSSSYYGNPAGYAAAQFLSGGINAVYDGVTEPFKMVWDLWQISGALGRVSAGEAPPDINYVSGFGKAIASQNMSTGDALWSIPKGIITTPWRLGTAIYEGDWRSVGYETVSLAGILEGARMGVRALAPEPGAQLGFTRLGTKATTDLMDVNGVSGGELPPLPSRARVNFFGQQPFPKEFNAGELSRTFEFGNDQAVFNGSWWGEQIPISEADWRGPYAVPEHGWSNAGTDLAILQRPSTWAWYGKTAPQGIYGYSRTFFGDKWSIGWYQPGGRMQAMIPNARTLIQPNDVTISPTPWSKP